MIVAVHGARSLEIGVAWVSVGTPTDDRARVGELSVAGGEMMWVLVGLGPRVDGAAGGVFLREHVVDQP